MTIRLIEVIWQLLWEPDKREKVIRKNIVIQTMEYKLKKKTEWNKGSKKNN